MNFEWFGSKKTNTDPMNSSFIEESIKPKKKEAFEAKKPYIDPTTKEKFYRLRNNREAGVQKMTTLLTKGIINCADIIEHEGRYYSHAQDIRAVASTEGNYASEIDADLFLLKHIFGDDDKIYYTDSDPKYQKDGWEKHQGIMTNTSKKKSYFFDFDSAFSPKYKFFETKDQESRFEQSILKNLGEDAFASGLHKSKDRKLVLSIIDTKATQFLEERFADEEFLEAVMKKSKTESLFAEKPLFYTLTQRLSLVREIARKELQKLDDAHNQENLIRA